MKSYPLYNEAGIENKYDPNTGYKMLVECPKCKRQIETPDQSFCLGCGFKLINMPDLTSLIATAYKTFNGEEVTDQKQIDEYDIRTYQGDVVKDEALAALEIEKFGKNGNYASTFYERHNYRS